MKPEMSQHTLSAFVPNPHNLTLQEIAERLRPAFPQATIKKPMVGPEYINVPVDNYRLAVHPQKAKNALFVDFHPPLLWLLLGVMVAAFLISTLIKLLLHVEYFALSGALAVLVAFFTIKGIFRNNKKEDLQRFYRELNRVVGNNTNGKV